MKSISSFFTKNRHAPRNTHCEGLGWIRTITIPSAVILLTLLMTLTDVAQARDFTIVGWGGTSQKMRREFFFKPFAKSKNIPFLEDVYLGGWGEFQAMKDTGQVPWDVVQVESSELMRGCEEGVLAPIDWSQIPDRDDLLPKAISDCGVGMTIWAACIVFNTEKIEKIPTKLTDFWDLQTWPGKRGMRQGPKINLEMALMADGVPPGEIYETLATPEGVDRAFKKLDEIKPMLQTWKSGAQAVDRIMSGDVIMSTSYNARVARARNEGMSIDLIWDGAVYAVDSWAVLAGSPHMDLANEFLRFFVASDKHYDMMILNQNTPPFKKTIARMDNEMLKVRPLKDNVRTALFMGTEEGVSFWLDNQDALTQRWNAWIGKD
jgi:putative spermidine/putrescine transport system substrate-binding protein